MRKFLFWLHLCIGVCVGMVILIMAATGAMMAFRPQIIDLAEGNVRRVQVPAGASRLSLDALLAAASTHKPGAKLNGFTVKADPAAAVMANLSGHSVFVDPYTGHIVGEASWVTEFMEGAEQWHRWLGMEGKLRPVGHEVKGVVTLLFVLLMGSGMYLWWPRKTMRLDRALKGRARHWNRHNTVGFWCAPFLLIIALTGIIMSYQWATDLLYHLTGSPLPAAAKAGPKNPGSSGQALGLEVLVGRAQERLPAWKSMHARLNDGGPVMFTIHEQGMHQRSQLDLDAVSGEAVKWEPYAQQNMGRKLRVLARYTHTGETGGVVGQALAFLAACGALVLVLTGFAMAGQRFTGWSRRKN